MKIIRRFLIAGVLAMPAFANAGIAVVVHPDTSASALSAEQISQLYQGRLKTLPGGGDAKPLDLPEGSPLRAQFAERVLGKTEQQLRSYWSRMIFTGKGQPPRVLATPAEVLRSVATTPGAVGYVDSKDVSPKVKVLFQVE